MGVALDECRTQRVFEGLTILKRDLFNRLHRVEVLGKAHGKTCITQFDNKTRHQVKDGHGSDHLSTDSSFAALAMSVWYLSRMWSVSFAS